MRLLTEYMSVPEINETVIADKARPGNAPLAKQAEPETAENRNLQLAKQVERYKTKLILALSRLPVTSLWVLNKYDQQAAAEEQDEDACVPSECDSLLSDIRKQYQLVDLLANGSDDTGNAYLSARSKLSASLAQFPYAFEDLVKLVDIVAHAYKNRGLSFSHDDHFDPKQAAIIQKRLESTPRHAKASHNAQLRALSLYRQEGQGLFLTVEDMAKLLPEVVLAEHEWLHYRKQLASANAKLVLFIANQYKGSFLDFDDLVQEGHTGLLKAVDRFKYRLGFQFSTYAGYWIRQAISRALSRSERVVRIPCGQVAIINKVFRSKDELTLKTGGEPSVKEVADYCQLTPDEVNQILAISQSAVALESFDDGEEEPSFAPIDFLEQQVFGHSFNKIAATQLENLMRNAVKSLNPREAKIVNSHFGVDSGQQQTLQEIGNDLNLTRERVRQIQAVALNKIKMRYGDQLASFIG